MGNGFSRWPVRQAGVYIGTGILVLLLIIGLIRVRHALLMVLNPFLVALILAYLLAPLVNIVEKREVSRSAAILLVFLVIALLVFVFSVRVVPPSWRISRGWFSRSPPTTGPSRNFSAIFSRITSGSICRLIAPGS